MHSSSNAFMLALTAAILVMSSVHVNVHVHAADRCVQSFGGIDGTAGDGLATIQAIPKPSTPMFQLRPCKQFTKRSCCTNAGAGEIGAWWEHSNNVGGTGGVPTDDGRCFTRARTIHKELQEYFCLFCNPDHLDFMSCCSKVSNDTKSCAGTETNYKAGSTCNEHSVNMIRLCESFVDRLWGKDGSKYDSCGMLVMVGGADDGSEFGHPIAGSNPNGIKPWADIVSSTPDDPITPSYFWEDDFANFARDVKPPLFDEFFIKVVPDAEGHCYMGSCSRGEDHCPQPGSAMKTAMSTWALAAISLSMLLLL